MITILFRTLVIYVALNAAVRLMGKRQIGELEVSDFVTTLLISEIASLPVTNQEIPVLYALLPIAVLLFLEVISSWLLLRFPNAKPWLSARPTVLIHKGVLQQKALDDNRVSVEELMGEIRQQGYANPSQVSEAILEKNGKLTVLPKAPFAAPTAEQLHLNVEQDDLMHVVFYGGKCNRDGLRIIGKDEQWFRTSLAERGADPRSLYCVTANESGELLLIPKQQKGEQPK